MSAKTDPATNAVAVTPSDTVNLSSPCKALYIGGAGPVAVIPVGGKVAVTFAAVPVGTILPVECIRVNDTNTTATNIVALY